MSKRRIVVEDEMPAMPLQTKWRKVPSNLDAFYRDLGEQMATFPPLPEGATEIKFAKDKDGNLVPVEINAHGGIAVANSNDAMFSSPPPDGKISVELNCSQEKLAAIAQIAANGGYRKLVGQPGVRVIDVGAGCTDTKGRSGDDDAPQASVEPIPLAAMFDYNTDYPENTDLYEKGVSPGKSHVVTQTSAAINLSDGGTTEGEQISIDPIETFFSPEAIDIMAKSASDYLGRPGHIPKGYQGMGEEAAQAILNNPSTKVFMKVSDEETAEPVAGHFGDNIVDPHGDPELVQKIVAVAADEGRNSDFHLVIAGSANDANLDGTGGASTVLASMTLGEKAAAVRFCDCCKDFDAGGYDVSSAMMKRLAEIGLVKHRGGGWYEGTELLNSVEDDLRAELISLNEAFLANTNPNIRLRVPDIDTKGSFEQFTKSLPRPGSPEAIEQIKKAVKEFRAAWQPMGKKTSLAQTYQMVAKALGFKTWEAMVAVVAKKSSRHRNCC